MLRGRKKCTLERPPPTLHGKSVSFWQETGVGSVVWKSYVPLYLQICWWRSGSILQQHVRRQLHNSRRIQHVRRVFPWRSLSRRKRRLDQHSGSRKVCYRSCSCEELSRACMWCLLRWCSDLWRRQTIVCHRSVQSPS